MSASALDCAVFQIAALGGGLEHRVGQELQAHARQLLGDGILDGVLKRNAVLVDLLHGQGGNNAAQLAFEDLLDDGLDVLGGLDGVAVAELLHGGKYRVVLIIDHDDGGAGDIDENALLGRRFGDIGGHGDRFQRDHARGFKDRDDEAAAPHQHALAQAGNDHGLIRRHSAPADQQQQQHRQHADANRNDPIHLNVSRSFSLFHAFGSGLRFPAYLTAARLTREVCLNASFSRLKTAGIPPFRQGFALPPPLKGRLCL